MRHLLLSCVLIAALVACDEVVVEAPDFGQTSDPGTPGEDVVTEDPGEQDDPGTSEDPGAGEDPGESGDPGTDDPGTDDPGQEDPGGEDIVLKDPQPAGEACQDPRECLSGECIDEVCNCLTAEHCAEPATMWCDNDLDTFMGLHRCFPKRDIYAGCTTHEQCLSGACDQKPGICSDCDTTDGIGCEDLGENFSCCFGTCGEACLGCPALPPPNPIMDRCMSGCYDPETQYCGPEGGVDKLLGPAVCNFQNQACLSGMCVPTQDGMNSECGCTDAGLHCISGWLCDTESSRCVPQTP